MTMKKKKPLFCFLQHVVLWLKRLLNLKTCLMKQRGEYKESEIVLIRGTFRDRMLAYSSEKVPNSSFIQEIWLPVRETRSFVLYPGDSIPDYLGELACMLEMVNSSSCTIELWCTREVAKHDRSVRIAQNPCLQAIRGLLSCTR